VFPVGDAHRKWKYHCERVRSSTVIDPSHCADADDERKRRRSGLRLAGEWLYSARSDLRARGRRRRQEDAGLVDEIFDTATCCRQRNW